MEPNIIIYSPEIAKESEAKQRSSEIFVLFKLASAISCIIARAFLHHVLWESERHLIKSIGFLYRLLIKIHSFFPPLEL